MGTATAFAPGAFNARNGMALNAVIAETLETLQGPEIFWGSEGVAAGFDEADIKGYDMFSKLSAALKENGVEIPDGEYTLLAPADSAFDKHAQNDGSPITADVLKYHVIMERFQSIQLPATRKLLME